nr:MAG TPA: FANCI solenoid 1 [Bacteriophage sp.]DAR43904.1 MAG TPA: FANCI solenoid 1 [Caudoviricetes sp.]DAU18651.1 MAG TPA: FANCI solenoid 1 [Caudoviricetes sp.]
MWLILYKGFSLRLCSFRWPPARRPSLWCVLRELEQRGW